MLTSPLRAYRIGTPSISILAASIALREARGTAPVRPRCSPAAAAAAAAATKRHGNAPRRRAGLRTRPRRRDDDRKLTDEHLKLERPRRTARLRDELRRLHGHARPEGVAERDRLARLAREARLLRRHVLPPDRPGLRDPGRRPDRYRHRRARLQDARQGRRRTRSTCTASSRWRRRAPSRRHRGQPVLRRHVDDASLPPDYAVVGKVTERPRRRRPDRQARRRDRAADARRRHLEGQRSRRRRSGRARGGRRDTLRLAEAAAVPAARARRAATRARSTTSSSSPARTSSRPTRASSTAPTGSAARARRCAAGCRALGRRRSRGDRPRGRPQARPARGRPRRRRVARRRRRPARGHVRRRATARTPSCSPASRGTTSPTRARARSTSQLVPCDGPAPPGDVDYG